MIETLIGVFLGGAITFLSTFFLQKATLSHADKIWLKEKRLELYTNLIKELQRINIPIVAETFEVNFHELTIDVDEVSVRFKSLVNYLEENSGAIYLFVENDLRKEIFKLQNEIYTIIDNTECQVLNLSEYKSSAIYKAISHAQEISCILRKNIVGK